MTTADRLRRLLGTSDDTTHADADGFRMPCARQDLRSGGLATAHGRGTGTGRAVSRPTVRPATPTCGARRTPDPLP